MFNKNVGKLQHIPLKNNSDCAHFFNTYLAFLKKSVSDAYNTRLQQQPVSPYSATSFMGILLQPIKFGDTDLTKEELQRDFEAHYKAAKELQSLQVQENDLKPSPNGDNTELLKGIDAAASSHIQMYEQSDGLFEIAQTINNFAIVLSQDLLNEAGIVSSERLKYHLLSIGIKLREILKNTVLYH